MDRRSKMAILGQASLFDLCDARPSVPAGAAREDLAHCISRAVMPGGRSARLLKVLLSSFCDNDCAYCALRSGRDVRRAAFTPDELARSFEEMWRAGLVDGLFLSSGVCHNAVREMDRMLATTALLRRRYGFRGYIHLKLLPGAEAEQIAQGIRLADRVSTNLEAPNAARLGRLSGRKIFESQLLGTLRTASRLMQRAGAQNAARSGLTTQFVVGAAAESDCEILGTADQLYTGLGLRRAYYSAFTPIPQTPLEGQAPTPPLRQQRLYESDFLLRDYGFRFDELIFGSDGNLLQESDPKLAWAQRHSECFPVEVNRASKQELLRVPGIGPELAERIVQERRRGLLTELSHLRKMGAHVERVSPFVLLNGRQPEQQLSLWSAS